jgi:hypothetical protein
LVNGFLQAGDARVVERSGAWGYPSHALEEDVNMVMISALLM